MLLLRPSWIFLILAVSVVPLRAQQTTDSTNAKSAAAGAHPAADVSAANAWMRVPAQDDKQSVTSSLRRERDSFWDKAIGAHEALTTTQPGMAISEGAWSAEEPEIPKMPNRAIITGRFVSYRSILSVSERSIYTEVTISIEKVFEAKADSAMPGQKITLALPGGTVVAPSGKVITNLTQPRKYFVQPGRRYLFVLTYQPTIDCYFLGDDWDISEGTVRINSLRSQAISSLGHSSLNGLSEHELEPVLDRILSTENQ
jgi:hypothetical protein